MSAVGSFEWGLRTGGALDDEARAELTEQLVRAAKRLAEPAHAANDVDVAVPDSALAKDAQQLCRDVSAPWLVGHCERTYLFAAGLGARAALNYDPEILYVAALLHDLGITPAYENSTDDECFAIAGARAALDFATPRSSEATANGIAEAISRHLNVDVAIEDGVEPHLLSAGVTLDVAGLGAGSLPKEFLDQVLRAHPRGATGTEIAGVIKRQADLHPNTRSGFLRQIGLADRALDNPLDKGTG